jgi:hypothetical protein
MKLWERTDKFDPRGAALADRHYSRRKVGSRQFMPPGQTIVMLADTTALTAGALWGWWRPDPSSGITAMNGLDGWTCTIFRNEGSELSSRLILDAELAWSECGYDIGPDGMLTYVWDGKVASVNPGFCFKMAGWSACGRSADGRKTLLRKAADRAGIARRG